MVKLTDLQIEVLELLKKRKMESQEFIGMAEGLQFQQIMFLLKKGHMEIWRTLKTLEGLFLIEKVGSKLSSYYVFNPAVKYEISCLKTNCPKCKTERTFHIEGTTSFSHQKSLSCDNPVCVRPNGERTRFWAKVAECERIMTNSFNPYKSKFDSTKYKNHKEYVEKQLEAKK